MSVRHCPEMEELSPWLRERNHIRDLIDDAVHGNDEALANYIMDIETALIAMRKCLDKEVNERITLMIRQNQHEDRLNEHSNILELHEEKINHTEEKQ